MKRLLFLHIALLLSLFAWSQGPTIATGVPYEFSFEANESMDAWTINPLSDANAPEQWMVGTAAHSEGRRSLYVSANGMNPSYNVHRNVTVAYLTYKFPAGGQYDISFDWRGVGSAASCLHLMVCPLTQLNNPNSQYYLGNIVSSTSGLSNNVPVMELGDSYVTSLYGSDTWQNVSLPSLSPLTIGNNASQQAFAIVFIWENQLNITSKDSVILSGFAIDNIQINEARLKKPQQLEVLPHCEDSTFIVNWMPGSGNSFDVQYRQVGNGNTSWRNAGSGLTSGTPGLKDTTYDDGTRHWSYSIPRILEGTYDVRVRGSYDGEMKTGWVYQSMVLVYCPDNHCINYIDLYSPNVLCQYGMNPDYYSSSGQTPYDNTGVINKGPDSEDSRHTLHVDPDETDPRTDDVLHTVPAGALASVRLGNWKSGAEAEAITYNITVDSASQGLLLVKYAVVLENPGSSHKRDEEPRFNLEILDQYGQPIDLTCGFAEFSYSEGVNAGWTVTKDDKAVFKDWTTIGVNLMQYDGQTIKVRFTTYDCSQSGHYGYAYFTVDCVNAHLETDNCGNDAKISCKAPDGFNYRWTDENGTFITDSAVLEVDAGMHTYTCTVSFVENPSCNFKLYTVSAPRFPVPEYTVENVFSECQSWLKFHNTSHVMNKYEGYENHTSEPCEDWHWEFRSLTRPGEPSKPHDGKEPNYRCPEEGDTIEITYTCWIGAEHACDSTRVDTIVVPNIHTPPSDSHETACASYKLGNEVITKDTTVTVRYSNFAGCDSVVTLYLKVWPAPEDTYRHDSICSDGYVSIDGIRYSQPLVNHEIFISDQHGCDSVVYLTLTVNERLQASVEPLAYVCPDEEEMALFFDITAGVYDSLAITFSTPELHDTVIYENVTGVTIPYSPDIKPGYYTATFTFYQFCCGTYVEQRPVDIHYSRAIVEQKWNDVLTVLAPNYNGGFEFVGFQWYKNGQPLEGETHSYIYQPLDFDASYYVVLTRSDSTSIATCPITPVYHEQQTPYPTIVPSGQRIPMYMERSATVWYYTVSGQLYSTFEMPQGYASLLTPNQKGAYILKSVDAEGQTKAQVILVE